jgi:hypothetical protein
MNLTTEMNPLDWLPLDVLIEIATYDETAWYNLYRVDSLFHEYAKSKAGITKFIILATNTVIETYSINTYLFNKLHSIYDEPAVIIKDGDKKWYRQGLLHRDNDLPAIIRDNLYQYWYKNGLIHRDNKEPAIIIYTGYKEWWINGIFVDVVTIFTHE